MWNIAIARYNKKINAIAEKRIFSCNSYNKCLRVFHKIAHKPVYMFHDNAVDLDKPSLGMLTTVSYKQEYSKIVD